MTAEATTGFGFGRPAEAAIELASNEFKRALIDGDSALAPGSRIWTGEHADELMVHFVGRPDEVGSSFNDKLAKQLGDVSAGAALLFAELYALDLLPLSDYRADTKRACIRVPLRIGGVETAWPDAIEAALDVGVLNGGVAFKTRRYWQLCYLVEFAAGFLALDQAERGRLLEDRGGFEERLDAVTTVNAPSQRSTVLYLFFPDFYLPIASADHKAEIRKAFGDLIGKGTGDVDGDLHAIQNHLSTEAGHVVDLYLSPYREKWDPKALSSTTYKVEPWVRFMSWGAKLAAAYDLEQEERTYKLEMAHRLNEARPMVLEGTTGWEDKLKWALGYGNLLSSFFKMPLFDALANQPVQIRDLLIWFWGDEPDPQLMTALHTRLKDVLPKQATPGNATALGSVLLMARDSAQYPPFTPEPVEKARKLTAHPASGTSPSERYADLLAMCDEILDRAADHEVELQDRLDAQGFLWAVVKYAVPDEWTAADKAAFHGWRGDAVPDDTASTPVKRAWLIRGSSVRGRDLVPVWLDRGSVSLAASRLRPVEAGMGRDELKPIVDEDYSHTSYAQKAEKLEEFHAFLARMQPGDIVATTTRGRLHVGRVEGPATFVQSHDQRSNLRRETTWLTAADGVDYAEVPPDLTARLQVTSDLLELTQQLPSLESIVAETPAPDLPQPPPAKVVLPDADDELATRLHVPREWLQDCIDLLNDRPQLIFYGPPGTGKTFIAQHLAEYVAGENVRLVQFHPAYSYEDFFEGYRPDASGGFTLRPGPMRRVVDAALENPGVPHILIIDEINRGNLAKVFGELYFLLEYRDRNVELLYASEEDKGFTLPRNVFIIGTMNTADRSIALVDTAMRRRFAFLPLHPAEPPASGVLRSWLSASDFPARAADLLDELNGRIDDADFQIGPSYFMRPAVHEERGFDRVWRTAILPLLEEHHYGELTRDEVAKRYGLAAVAARVDAAAAASGIPAPPEPVHDGEDVDAAPDAD